jgi:hypothetical protein
MFNLSTEEQLLIEALRAVSGSVTYRMVIEFRDGAWELSQTVGDRGHTGRGTGRTFSEAWNNMNPTRGRGF